MTMKKDWATRKIEHFKSKMEKNQNRTDANMSMSIKQL
jgi:hypothetical protein